MAFDTDSGLSRLAQLTYAPLRAFAATVGSGEPDDLVQEAFVRFIQRPGGIVVANPLAYLRRIVMNLAIDEARRTRTRDSTLRRVAVIETIEPHYPSDISALLALDPRSRALLYLTEIEGAPISEAAGIVGCSEASARMRLSRARRKLRALIEEERDDVTSSNGT